MNKLLTKIVGLSLGLSMAIGVGVAASYSEKDTVRADASYIYTEVASGSCSGFSSGYGVHKTATDSQDRIWVGSYGQAGYLGANSATNFDKALLTNSNDLAVAKGYDSTVTNQTKGYVVFYCETGFANIGKVVYSTTAKATGGQATSYLLAKTANGSWGQVTLASDSPTSQGAKVSTSNAYTFTYTFTPNSAVTQFAMLFYRNGYTRQAGSVMTLYSATESGDPSVTFTNPTDYVGAGSNVTNTATGDHLEGATISYESSNTSVATVDSATGEVTGISIGSSTITAKATVSGVDYSDSYTIYVTSSPSAYYTVAQARSAIDVGKGLTNQYVKGTVYHVDSFNETYHSITYWISDNGSNTNPLQVYSGLGIGGAQFSSIDDVKVGDLVVVTGTLKKHNSTYEFDYNNELVKQAHVSSIAVKTAPTKTSYDEGEYFEPTGLVVSATYDDSPASTKDYAYADLSSSFEFNPSTSTALTNETEVAVTLFGKTVAQAISVTGRTISSIAVTGDMTNKTYVKDADWDFTGLSLTVTYESGNPSVIPLTELTAGEDFTISKQKADGTTSLIIDGTYEEHTITSRTITGISYVSEVTFTAGEDVGTSTEQKSDSILKYGVTLSCTSFYSASGDYRFYKDSVVTLSSSGENIRKIEFTDGSDSKNPITNLVLKAGESGTYENLIWTGDDSTVEFTASAQARASVVKVTTGSGVVHVNGLAVNGEAATIGQEFDVNVVKNSSTYQLDVTVTPDNTTDSKVINYSVTSGSTDIAVDANGVITASSTVGDTAVIRAESDADSTYYVLFNVTVVDYQTVYDIDFNCSTSSTEFNEQTWNTATSGSDADLLTFGSISKVYPDSNYIKFGSSSNAGSVTLTTPDGVDIERVILRAKAYGGSDVSNIAINGETSQTATEEWSYLVFDLETITDEITIAGTKASKGRFYIEDIVFIGTDNQAAVGAYGYAADFMNSLDEECSELAVTTSTWSSLNTKWTTMGSTYSGSQAYLKGNTPDENGHLLEKVLARYDFIVGKYNKTLGLEDYTDFMDRDPSPVGGARTAFNLLGDSSTSIVIIVVIASVSITSIGALLVLKKRKEQF